MKETIKQNLLDKLNKVYHILDNIPTLEGDESEKQLTEAYSMIILMIKELGETKWLRKFLSL